MATPVEMMLKQVFRALGVNADELLVKVGEIRLLAFQGFEHAMQANRRLMRIETHLGLSDIEPINVMKEIEHVQNNDANGPASAG